MEIKNRERKVKVSKVLRAHVKRKLSFALGRFGGRIGRVIVRFSNADDHTGHMRKRCQLDVVMCPQHVRAEDTDADAFAAVNHAVQRVSRSVARALDRARDWDASLEVKR